MRTVLKIVVVAIGFLMLNACANTYKIATKAVIDISNYSIYVFRLCEKIKVEGSERFLSCDEHCEPNNILAVNGTQVREELYLLIEKQGDKVIYLTTKTDRSFDMEPDIFNTELHKNYVFANDLENVYFGIMKQNAIVFTNKNETLTLQMTPRDNNACDYIISTLLSKTKDDTPINNQLVTLRDVYSIPIRFIKSKRILAIQENKKTELDTVKTIGLNGKRIILKGNTQSIEGSQKRRLKYHPNFND